MERYCKLRETVKKQFSVTTQELVDKALLFAMERMEGLTRYDGTPMLDHAAEVAHIVATEVGLGRNSTVASILHDVVRIEAQKENDGELEELLNTIRKEFGEEVIGIVIYILFHLKFCHFPPCLKSERNEKWKSIKA